MSIKEKTILIVDDDPSICMLVDKILTNAGAVCYNVQSVKMARNFLQTKTPHLIILDLKMPEENGFVLLNERRQNAVLSHIPVLVFSADDKETTVLKALKLGASNFLLKPLNASLLLQKVRRVFLDTVDTSKFYILDESENVDVKVDCELLKINAEQIVLKSPLKLLFADELLSIESEIFERLSEKKMICKNMDPSRESVDKGQYVTELKIMGLKDSDKQSLFKFIKGWR